VGRNIVMMKEPVVVGQGSGLSYSRFSLENATVKFGVHDSVRRNKFVNEFSKLLNIISRFAAAWSS
jgi:hypothetical protein